MRSVVLSNRISSLLKAASLSVLAGVIAGCSSGFQRFDTSIYESAIPQQTSQTANPYPGDIDTTTTASLSNDGVQRVTPMRPVAPRPVPQASYHQAEPTYVQPQVYKPYQPAIDQQQTASTVRDERGLTEYQRSVVPNWTPKKSIQSQDIPKPTSYANTGREASYTQPAPVRLQDANTVLRQSTDQITTSAVDTASRLKPASVGATNTDRKGGWTRTGGTVVRVHQGETLYNLSKRYGVPATEILSANGLSSANDLRAGQEVVIPNYVFAENSPVSAPDNNPATRAARASTGLIGEADFKKVAVPTKRPYEVAAVSPSGQVYETEIKRYKPKDYVVPPKENNTPDHSVVTGSVEKPNIDPMVTGSDEKPTVKSSQNIASVDTQAKAPAKSGIENFRWPVKGRVISSFGDRSTNGKNEGIDISVPEGTAVRSAENGVVIYAGDEISTYGNLILVRHENDWVSAYAHNKDFKVKKGDRVSRGQIIARSGKTGDADRPKLHFELRKNSNPVDPKRHLSGA
ncbi:MAG: peptidoglycan DD-metalloendopeptidase family protein [Pseudomonadota bacterium]